MTYSVQKDPKKRKALIDGLAERGYNAHLILEDDWDEEGYYMIVTDSKGKALRDGDYVHRVWQEWDSPDDYRFVRDMHRGGI